MTAAARMLRRRAKLRLVIFDCDGVLVDSEAVVNAVVAEDLTAIGWPMTGGESEARFRGMALRDMVPVIETRLGRPLPADWRPQVSRRILAALSERAVLVAGAREVLEATTALGLPWRIASNSSHEEMAAKFRRTGLLDMVAGRLHSHRDVGRAKPAPDLFLAAAAAEGVAPAGCVVVEDSVPGARAAAAAGMDCLGFSPQGDDPSLRQAGAALIHSLAELPALFRLALEAAA